MSDMRCDIILPVCDQFQFTKNCIESIIANTATPYRIIVINNGRNENTKAYLGQIQKRLGNGFLAVQNETNIGWVKALNMGIKLSDAPFLCFQNDDTVVTKDWLGKMIRILQDHPDVGIVNPAWEGRPQHMPIDEYGRRLEKKCRGKFMETDWARGFSVILKRAVIDKIGGVDEIYGLAYFDDVDFSVRAIEAGFRVVLALDTYVYHHRNVTFFEVLKGKKWNELHEKNKLIYYRRFGRPLRVAMVLSKEVCKDKAALRSVRETAYYLARKQHHLDIWSPCNVDNDFSHTNIDCKSRNPLLMRLLALCDLYANGGKKREKRYSGVFIFDRAFGNFAERSGLLRNVAIHTRPESGDFNGFIRSQVDALKEATKQETTDAGS